MSGTHPSQSGHGVEGIGLVAATAPDSGDLLESVLSSAPIVLWEIDVAGTVTLSTGQGLSVLGVKPGELLGRSIYDLYGGWPDVIDDVRRALAGEEVRSTVDLDGFYFDSCYAPLRDDEGDVVGVRGVATVITPQKRAEQACRESQQRYQTLTRIAPVGIFHVDAAGECLYVNEQWKALTGLSLDEARRDGWMRSVHPEDRERVIRDWRGGIEQGRPSRSEFRFQRSDGSTTWVLGQAEPELDEAGAVTSFVGTVTPIDDRVQIEQAQRELNQELESRIHDHAARLRRADLTLQEQIQETKRTLENLAQSQARWKSVVDDASDYILIIDRQGTITYINHPVPPLKMEDVVGKSIFEFLPPNEHDNARRMTAAVFEGSENLESEMLSIGPFDSTAWYSSRYGAVKVDDEVVGVSIVSRDITRDKEIDEEMRRRRAELAHVSRLNTMGEMAATLAHELNQPLSAIANYAAGCALRLQAGPVETGELARAAEIIVKQANGANEIIGRILDFVRKKEGVFEPVSVNDLVTGAMELAQPELRRQHVEVVLAAADDLPPIVADGVQIEQVLLNLIMNAIESMHDTASAERKMTITTSQFDGRLVEISVSDRGCGLPDDFADWVFEPFQSSKSHGLGMGLSISRTIAELHQGRLWAARNNDSGGGATFYLSLPVSRGDELK